MKKVFTLFAIIGMFFFVSCGDSTANKEKGNEDGKKAAEELLDEADADAGKEIDAAPVIDTTEKDTTKADPAPVEGDVKPKK